MVEIRLKAVLKRKKIPHREFARMIGVDYRNLLKYLRPNVNPTIGTLECWARALDCRIRDLFRDIK